LAPIFSLSKTAFVVGISFETNVPSVALVVIVNFLSFTRFSPSVDAVINFAFVLFVESSETRSPFCFGPVVVLSSFFDALSTKDCILVGFVSFFSPITIALVFDVVVVARS